MSVALFNQPRTHLPIGLDVGEAGLRLVQLQDDTAGTSASLSIYRSAVWTPDFTFQIPHSAFRIRPYPAIAAKSKSGINKDSAIAPTTKPMPIRMIGSISLVRASIIWALSSSWTSATKSMA